MALGALYVGIGNYGDFISGMETIRGQVSYLGTKLVESARSPLGGDSVRVSVQNRGGTLSQLRRLFQKVQRRELTADQAMIEAERLLGDEANTSPEFMKALRKGLSNAPLLPQQIPLLDEPVEEPGSDVEEVTTKKKPRTPVPRPDTPINQFRIEIWRESKKKKKNVKVTKL